MIEKLPPACWASYSHSVLVGYESTPSSWFHILNAQSDSVLPSCQSFWDWRSNGIFWDLADVRFFYLLFLDNIYLEHKEEWLFYMYLDSQRGKFTRWCFYESIVHTSLIVMESHLSSQIFTAFLCQLQKHDTFLPLRCFPWNRNFQLVKMYYVLRTFAESFFQCS